MKPQISVIMLTYNREKFVRRMIDCILEQTFRDFEFIVVDNGSTDESGKIADRYAETDERIKVIHTARGNIGSGRNAGIDLAKGDYIVFVDDDDTCEPDYLQFLYELIIENDADIAICGATWADKDEKRIMNPEEAIETLLWRKNYNVAFPTKMFRRTLFDNNRFLETGKYDDIYLMPKILARAERIAYHGLSKYHFERHESNNSAWTQHHELLNAETLQEYLNVYAERTAWLSEKFPGSADKWRYFSWSFMISMVEKVERLGQSDCFEIRDRLVAELAGNYEEFYGCEYTQKFEKEWVRRYII